MYTSTTTFSVTDLRHKTVQVLKAAGAKGYVYLITRSRPTAAVVDIAYLTALQEAYEDHLDTLEFDATVGLPRVALDRFERKNKKAA